MGGLEPSSNQAGSGEQFKRGEKYISPGGTHSAVAWPARENRPSHGTRFQQRTDARSKAGSHCGSRKTARAGNGESGQDRPCRRDGAKARSPAPRERTPDTAKQPAKRTAAMKGGKINLEKVRPSLYCTPSYDANAMKLYSLPCEGRRRAREGQGMGEPVPGERMGLSDLRRRARTRAAVHRQPLRRLPQDCSERVAPRRAESFSSRRRP